MFMSCSPGRGSLGDLEDELDDALDPTTGGGEAEPEQEQPEQTDDSTGDEDE